MHGHRSRSRRATLLAIGLTVFAAFAAADTSRIEDPVVRACAERALPERAMFQALTVRVVDHTGKARESRGEFHWKRFDDGLSRVLVRITEPPHTAGLAVLMIERESADPDVYMYLPDARRTRRMTSGVLTGRMLGTDFSYEDFAHFQQLTKSGQVTRLPDEMLDERPVHVIETLTDDETSEYGRILTRLDTALCVPVLTEFYTRSGQLAKTLAVPVEDAHEFDGRHVPHSAVMTDHRQESRSELTVTEVEIDPEIRDTFFSPTGLRQGG